MRTRVQRMPNASQSKDPISFSASSYSCDKFRFVRSVVDENVQASTVRGAAFSGTRVNLDVTTCRNCRVPQTSRETAEDATERRKRRCSECRTHRKAKTLINFPATPAIKADAKKSAVRFYEKRGFTMLDTATNKALPNPVMFILLNKLTTAP
jgi:hypothetical protein